MLLKILKKIFGKLGLVLLTENEYKGIQNKVELLRNRLVSVITKLDETTATFGERLRPALRDDEEKLRAGEERYNEIDNLTVLCRSCHMSYHRKAGHIIVPPHKHYINKWGRRGKIIHQLFAG